MKALTKINTILKSDTIRNGSLFSLFSFINKGIGFFLLLILANFITPTEYGYLNLFSTVLMVMGYFTTMSSDGYLSVSYFRDGKDAVEQCISSALLTAAITSTLFVLILFFWGEFISSRLHLPIQVLYLAILIRILSVPSGMAMNYFRIQKKVLTYGILSCGNSLLFFCFAIFFVKWMQLSWQGYVLSQTSCNFIFGIWALCFFLHKKFFCRPSIDFWKKMLLWGIPLIPHLATIFIKQGCDRYIINHFHGVEEVGLFSFALNLANIIVTIGMAFNASNSVNFFEILSNTKIDNIQKGIQIKNFQKNIFLIYLSASVIITIAGIVFTPIFLPKYENSIPYFAILAIFGFIRCQYFLFTNILFYYKKTKNLMYITFFSSISHLIMSLILTRYSLYYTCVIYCISELLIVLLVYKKSKDLLERNLQEDIINT